MPTYVYKNLETGEIYEFKQSMRDDAYTHHPETGAPVKRVLSRPGIAFRGSGFYVNDSRPSQGGDTPKAASSGDSAPAIAAPAKEPGSSKESSSSKESGSSHRSGSSSGRQGGRGGE